MIYYIVLFIILLILSVSQVIIASNESLSQKPLKFLYGGVAFYLILLVGLRNIGVSVDDINYVYLFNSSGFGQLRKDVAFYILSNLLPSIHLLFIMFAFVSISLKAAYVFTEIKYFGLCFLLYYSSYFFLHDFVQIRAAVASGLLFWMVHLISKKKILPAVLLFLTAISFHLSALSFILFFFLGKTKTKLFYQVLGIVSLILAFVIKIDINSFEWLIPELIFKRLQIFLTDPNRQANLLNPIALMQYVIAILVFIKWDKITKLSAEAIYFIKIYLIGLYIFLIMYNLPGIGFRIYELFAITQIPIASYLIMTFERKYIIVGFIITLSILYAYYYLIKYPVVQHYTFLF